MFGSYMAILSYSYNILHLLRETTVNSCGICKYKYKGFILAAAVIIIGSLLILHNQALYFLFSFNRHSVSTQCW